MVYQPACGARDILPLDVARQRWLEQRLERVFQSWGLPRNYHTDHRDLGNPHSGGGTVHPRDGHSSAGGVVMNPWGCGQN